MTVDISQDLFEALRKQAQAEGREFAEIVNDAVREYLVAASITDVSAEQIGETQLAMTHES